MKDRAFTTDPIMNLQMAQDYQHSQNPAASAPPDTPLSTTDSILSRGRGYTTSKSRDNERQRSATSAAAQPFERHANATMDATSSSTRSPPLLARAQSVAVASNGLQTRSLLRSQSHVSVAKSTKSPSPSLSASRDSHGQDDFASRNSSVDRRRDATSPVLPISTFNGLPQPSSVTSRGTPKPPNVSVLTSLPNPTNSFSHKDDVKTAHATSSTADTTTTIGTFALEQLFTAFARLADAKIELCCATPYRMSDRIEHVCASGIDHGFDQLLCAMGRVVRHRPKPLIDMLMNWKRELDELAWSSAKTAIPDVDHPKASVDIRDSPLLPPHRFAPYLDQKLLPYGFEAESAECRSSAGTYLLCRALTEILNETNLTSLTPALSVVLADIAFDGTASKIAQEDMRRSPMQRAKWVKAVELLSVLSRIDFSGVMGRYLRDLQACQSLLMDKTAIGRFGAESKAQSLLRGMRQLQPVIDQDDTKSTTSWIELAGRLTTIQDFLAGVHGQDMKTACCNTIEGLLLRFARSTPVITNDAKWLRIVISLHDRLAKLASKAKYWSDAYSAQIALACVSPSDVFAQRWHNLITNLPARLKDSTQRSVALKAACRMTWCFVQRNANIDTPKAKSLEDLMKSVFLPARKFPLAREANIREAVVQLIRIVASVLPELSFKAVIFPLLHTDLLLTKENPGHQALDPDRIIVGIQSAVCIFQDSESKQEPDFPLTIPEELGGGKGLSPWTVFSSRVLQKSRIGGSIDNRAEGFATPVQTELLSSTLQTYHSQFCNILGKILRVCDGAFGGQAVVDERLSSPTARTPLMETRRAAKDDDKERFEDDRYEFYDLLHYSIQALPCCLSRSTPINELVHLLCTGSAHVEKEIAASSMLSLKSIARQGYAELIATRFSAFIQKYENRYATMSDGGLLGPAHIDSTLQLYVELLHIWVEQLSRRADDHNVCTSNEASGDTHTPSGRGHLDVATSHGHVDRVEAQGLFFLCSPSNRVRGFAIDVLRLVTKLDEALGDPSVRIYGMLTSSSASILDMNGVDLSISERARLQKAVSEGNTNDTLVEICKSGDPADSNLWTKAFPRLVEEANALCTVSVAQTRDSVCLRLSQLQPVIECLPAERTRAPTVSATESAPNGRPKQFSGALTDITIEQWRLYLVFACATINRITAIAPDATEDPGHVRQNSRSSQRGHDTISTAADLFSRVIPLLSASKSHVRSAVVSGLSSINVNLYKPLLEALLSASQYHNHFHGRSQSHYRTASSPQRQSSSRAFHTEIVQVYELTSHFLNDPKVNRDESILEHVSNAVRDLAFYLGQDNAEPENYVLRKHFCGLLERFFLSLNRLDNSMRWLPFQTRKATYVALEEWTEQLSPIGQALRSHGAAKETTYQSPAHTQVQKQKLRLAAWSAMATLCAGPMQVTVSGGGTSQFNASRILSWIDDMLRSDGDKSQTIGRRALQNLILYNEKHTLFLDLTIEKLYGTDNETKDRQERMTEGCLTVLHEAFCQTRLSTIAPWRLIAALLFTLGHSESSVRAKALRLLRDIEGLHSEAPRLHKYDTMVFDRTRAVNLRAQYELISGIILGHQDFVYNIFSLYSEYLVNQTTDAQRSMIRTLLPWMRQVDLQVDSNGKPTSTSHMVLLNMLYISVKCGNVLHTELQALWHGLVTGEYRGNVSAILEFVINSSLDCRDEQFIRLAKQIMVYMASVTEGKGIIEYFMKRIDPRSMAGPDQRISLLPEPDAGQFPFMASLDEIFPSPSQQSKLSMGQLSLILLVDLLVDDDRLALENLPALLQIVLVLWDHHLYIVQDQAREMLVHLVHVIMIREINDSTFESREPAIEDLVQLIRRHDPKVVWRYSDNSDQYNTYELPHAMTYVVSEVVSLFTLTAPSIAQSWAEMAMSWALICPVKHLACRSLQLYRTLYTSISRDRFSEFIMRSATAIADVADDSQAYAKEMIRTVRTIVQKAHPGSVLFDYSFWFVVTCLDTVHDWEYFEAMAVLELVLEKSNLQDDHVVAPILDAKPMSWKARPEALIDLVYKGCQSGHHLDKTLETLVRLMERTPSPIVGNKTHLSIVFLAHLPRLLHSFEETSFRPLCLSAISQLRSSCEVHSCDPLLEVLERYTSNAFRSKDDFLRTCVICTKQMLGVQAQVAGVQFLLSLLVNPIPWMKIQTLTLLGALLPVLEPIGPNVLESSPELFDPLLRLLQTDSCSDALTVVDLLLPASGSLINQRITPGDKMQIERRFPLFSVPVVKTAVKAARTSADYLEPVASKRQKRLRITLVELADLSADPLARRSTSVPTPEVEFLKEEISPNSYFPLSDGAPIAETNMTELVSHLNSLDDIFADVDDDEVSFANNEYQAPPPAADLLYSRRLRQNTNRHEPEAIKVVDDRFAANPLGAQDARMIQHRPQVMSPSAFTINTTGHSKDMPKRPSISRSITMPEGDFTDISSNASYKIARSQDTDPSSEDDYNPTSGSTAPGLNRHRTVRQDVPMGKPRSGLRNSIKRLTTNDKHRRSPAAGGVTYQDELSPQVPKVPEEYLQNPVSSEF